MTTEADMRIGPGVYFSEAAPTSCCRRLKIEAKATVLHTQRTTSTQKLSYSGEILAYESELRQEGGSAAGQSVGEGTAS